jgi:hypothetical protein
MASIVEGKRRGAENAHQERAWLAWTIAALQRAKRMPALTEIAGKKKRAPKRHAASAEALMTMAHMWTAATGGKME